MCAGTTVFAPFVEHHISPTDRVGVVGIGGLGHLALQVASKYVTLRHFTILIFNM